VNKFKIGDRVRVYGCSIGGTNINEATGQVREICNDSGLIDIIIDGSITFTVHHKQCRKLNPKEKPEFE
jgi:hypothetical protein